MNATSANPIMPALPAQARNGEGAMGVKGCSPDIDRSTLRGGGDGGHDGYVPRRESADADRVVRQQMRPGVEGRGRQPPRS